MNASPLFFVRQGIESVYQAAKQRLRRCTKPNNHDPVPNAAIDLKRATLLLAVRSSATAEDLLEASFAGQQETLLNVDGYGEVLEAVERCWASLWTARAIGYRLRQGIGLGQSGPQVLSLAVAVQLLVPAEAAGILFTANPITGRRDQVMISAAWGLGEAVVGGPVTPDAILVDKAGGVMLEHEIRPGLSPRFRMKRPWPNPNSSRRPSSPCPTPRGHTCAAASPTFCRIH